MRFAFIQQHAEEFPVDVMCNVLGVSRSGYYAWRDRPASRQAQRRDQLVERIQAAHADSQKNYGSPRIHRELREQGIMCSENTVARLMKDHGIRSKMHRRFVVQTDSRHPHPIAENRLNQ